MNRGVYEHNCVLVQVVERIVVHTVQAWYIQTGTQVLESYISFTVNRLLHRRSVATLRSGQHPQACDRGYGDGKYMRACTGT